MTTITIERDKVERWLSALEVATRFVYQDNRPECEAAVEDLRTALAAPATAPEPVAWLASYVDRYGSDREYVSTDKALANENDALGNATPLYRHPPATAPAQPSWQDAPTEPGMWACLYMGELSTAIFNAYEIEHFDRDEMVGCRWQFIPDEDKP